MRGFVDRLRGQPVDPGDKALIDRMRKGGEKLSTLPRETTHYLYFASEIAAQRAAEQARTSGFEAKIFAPGDGVERWSVHAVHTILVGEDTISPARRDLTAIAREAGGEYDGWDTYADAALARMGMS